jgi:hypothetical protein
MKIQDTEAWSSKYQIPSFDSMNPHAFTAYVLKLIEHDDSRFPILAAYSGFLDGCRVQKGLYKRYPDGSAGNTSWDEVIGIAKIFGGRDVYGYLESTDGIYDWENPESRDERRNLYRLPFIRPLLRVAGNMRLSLIDQGILALWILWDAFNGDKGMSGHLQVWLYGDSYEKYFIPTAAMCVWNWRMRVKGITVNKMFSEYFHDKPRFKVWLDENVK